MIGDSWDADIVGAYNSQIDQLWLNPKNEKPRDFEPTFTVQKLEEIKKIL
jgi:putative hydrolase of the HAD superfamily